MSKVLSFSIKHCESHNFSGKIDKGSKYSCTYRVYGVKTASCPLLLLFRIRLISLDSIMRNENLFCNSLTAFKCSEELPSSETTISPNSQSRHINRDKRHSKDLLLLKCVINKVINGNLLMVLFILRGLSIMWWMRSKKRSESI